MFTKRFPNTGAAFSGLRAAEQWLHANGYSCGSMQRDQPIGIIRGEYVVAKWRNLTQGQRYMLDGTLVPDGAGFRDSDAVVQIREAAVAA